MNGDIRGKWYNQHGSELVIETLDGGRITGTFRSGAGCAKADEAFPVTGLIAANLVGFTVAFEPYDSLTSWSGHLGEEDGATTIFALWHMAVRVPGASGRDRLWEGIWAGADTFRREPQPASHRARAASHPAVEA